MAKDSKPKSRNKYPTKSTSISFPERQLILLDELSRLTSLNRTQVLCKIIDEWAGIETMSLKSVVKKVKQSLKELTQDTDRL